MFKSRFAELSWPLLFVCILATNMASAQVTQLYAFNPGDGPPTGGVIQGFDGRLYGTTGREIFYLSGVTEEVLYFFCTQPGCSDGWGTFGGVIQASDGNFYGTTSQGGTDGCGGLGCGTVFTATPSATVTTLYRFGGGLDGALPFAGVIQGRDGDFYGTTVSGGANKGGTVFKITSNGNLTVMYSFCAKANCADGASPQGALVQGKDGNFYGTTSAGGSGNLGTVFKITSAGKLTTLHRFVGADGASPFAGLIQAKDGKFYGTTSEGGAFGLGAIFRITGSGELATLYSFCGQGLPFCLDGANPFGGLVQSVQGTLFGTTFNGGTTFRRAPGAGTVFGFVPLSGSLVTEYTFGSVAGDGMNPSATLEEGTDGNLYGTTVAGGQGSGIVFSLFSGDAPFIKTNPTSGRVGAAVTILGNQLTGATQVKFGGTAAQFTVVSSSSITTTVPIGASTGKVSVVTPSGKRLSKVPFRVTP